MNEQKKPVVMGTLRAGGGITLSREYSAAAESRDRAAEEAKYKDKIGLAIIIADRKLQEMIAQKNSATDENEKARLDTEVKRLASMLVVLEYDTGVFDEKTETELKLKVINMDEENKNKYSRMAQEKAWKKLSLSDAIAQLGPAWEKEQETHKDNPDYLAKRRKAFNDAILFLQELKSS